MHPAAHSEGRPSFASLVANVDSATAKYIADCRVQISRQEMIEDLKEMAVVSIRSTIVATDADAVALAYVGDVHGVPQERGEEIA